MGIDVWAPYSDISGSMAGSDRSHLQTSCAALLTPCIIVDKQDRARRSSATSGAGPTAGREGGGTAWLASGMLPSAVEFMYPGSAGLFVSQRLRHTFRGES